ncbi:MAG: hypothetical protein HYZ28_05090 [Myxococcales bacterium]|nr:hypothetical protein [Myxococcales bacterium]
MNVETDIKKVGKSGQISLGKQHAGQYFREERREDGTIVLVPVVVVSRSHWTLRDEAKIRRALAWAAKTPPEASDVDALVAKTLKQTPGKRRGR